VTITEAGAALRERKISCVELTREALSSIERHSNLNAFITVTAESALRQAQERDHELARGEDRGPLHGIPIAHKDIFDTAGVRTTAGSKIFADRVPGKDAEVVARLARAGAVMVGKTNLHELCYGITSSNPHYGAVRNPHDLERIPGGSSGGSAAAVAAGCIFMGTGTDTGGSIRIPAAMCGVVGLKPTYDNVSREGVGPLGFTLDHVGPITRTVEDAAICYSAMSGNPVDSDARKLRIGFPKTFFFDQVDSEVRDAVRAVGDFPEVDGPDVEPINAIGRLLLFAETATVWRRYLDRRRDFGADVLSGIDSGLQVSATDYLDAQRLRRVLAGEFGKVWDKVDLLLTPATPTTAPKIGETTIELHGVSQDVRLASTSLVRPFNVLGWPALVLPCGVSRNGLPIGMQLVAPPGRERDLFAAAKALSLGLHHRGVNNRA
jgi:aspartyl-tRNA(Asn)/glutamyl-tRNA(Gln) amidotransferase subunit A